MKDFIELLTEKNEKISIKVDEIISVSEDVNRSDISKVYLKGGTQFLVSKSYKELIVLLEQQKPSGKPEHK
jgi:hypothetical protein